jgi:hypothetical protein
VSASGALVEGARPLRPGARVELHLAIDGRRVVLPGRVARCLVAAIEADRGIIYHAGLSFDQRFDWSCGEHTRGVSGMPRTCRS